MKLYKIIITTSIYLYQELLPTLGFAQEVVVKALPLYLFKRFRPDENLILMNLLSWM